MLCSGVTASPWVSCGWTSASIHSLDHVLHKSRVGLTHVNNTGMEWVASDTWSHGSTATENVQSMSGPDFRINNSYNHEWSVRAWELSILEPHAQTANGGEWYARATPERQLIEF